VDFPALVAGWRRSVADGRTGVRPAAEPGGSRGRGADSGVRIRAVERPVVARREDWRGPGDGLGRDLGRAVDRGVRGGAGRAVRIPEQERAQAERCRAAAAGIRRVGRIRAADLVAAPVGIPAGRAVVLVAGPTDVGRLVVSHRGRAPRRDTVGTEVVAAGVGSPGARAAGCRRGSARPWGLRRCRYWNGRVGSRCRRWGGWSRPGRRFASRRRGASGGVVGRLRLRGGWRRRGGRVRRSSRVWWGR
jgi:hypothetical protein